MKKTTLLQLVALFAVVACFQSNVAAQEAKPPESAARATEIENLKRRIEDLETQNRAILQMLTELKAKLDTPNQLTNASESRSAVSPSAPTVDRLATRRQPDTASSRQPSAAVASQPPAADSSQAPRQNSSASSEPVRWSDLIGEGNKIKLYGLLRLDFDVDSQRPNNGQIPFFIASEDPRLGSVDAENFSMHPRLTRFGVDYTGPRIASLGDAKLAGKLELDFENGGSESRQIIRIRHAYFNLKWNEFSILGGQTWDVVSPLFPTVNNDTLMWNAGNVGDRRPQFRIAYEPKAGRGQWSLIAAAGLMGAIDAQDLDANGFRDGEESGRPNVQARIGYSHAAWVKDQRASFGISGFYGWLETSRAIAGRTSFHSQMINIDYTLPLANRLSLRGEGWWGRNMNDVRGGAGQGINVANGREIRGRGGWSELSVKLSRYWSAHPGFTTDDPVDEDLAVGGRTRNRAFYFGNRITPGGNFTIGADYLRWKTDFKGFLRGIDNRLNIFLQYGF